MAQPSPELIEETISIFESRTGEQISEEKCRQALENISGFFQLLADWDQAEAKHSCENASLSQTVSGDDIL